MRSSAMVLAASTTSWYGSTRTRGTAYTLYPHFGRRRSSAATLVARSLSVTTSKGLPVLDPQEASDVPFPH